MWGCQIKPRLAEDSLGRQTINKLFGWDSNSRKIFTNVIQIFLFFAEGVQLLCLINKGIDACRYLITYGEWSQAVWLAKVCSIIFLLFWSLLSLLYFTNNFHFFVCTRHPSLQAFAFNWSCLHTVSVSENQIYFDVCMERNVFWFLFSNGLILPPPTNNSPMAVNLITEVPLIH